VPAIGVCGNRTERQKKVAQNASAHDYPARAGIRENPRMASFFHRLCVNSRRTHYARGFNNLNSTFLRKKICGDASYYFLAALIAVWTAYLPIG
jgi:hypothetical protein